MWVIESLTGCLRIRLTEELDSVHALSLNFSACFQVLGKRNAIMSDSAEPCTRGHRSHVKRKSQSGNHHEQLSQMGLSAFLLLSRILQRTRPRQLSQFSQVIVVKPDFLERCNWYDTCCSHP